MTCKLAAIGPARMFARYGYPNDLLGRLARAGARVVDVPVRPVYGPGWRSGIRVWTVIYPISFVLVRAFLLRIFLRIFARGGRLTAGRPAVTHGIRQASGSV